MPNMTIDGKPCSFEGKQTILQVALESEIEIPHYCYHPGLSIVASCRICLVEVAQPNPRNDNKVELVPKLLPACQTPASEGMEVYTSSPKAIANQKAVMEYLLINHPLDCPVCDQAGECYLQDYSYKYGRSVSRFEEDKIKQATKDIGPNVKLYSDRCIMCSRCVRFCQEVTGTGEIGVFGRGASEEIDVFPGKPLDNELSANVVDICPVGALLDKDFLFTRRVWELKQTPSIDGITASGDNIYLEHAEDQIYRVKPRANPDVNKWWISDEIRFGFKFVHSEDRLTTPMRSQVGSQVQGDWKRAIRDAADMLLRSKQENDPGSLAVMISPMLSCEEAYLLAKLAIAIDPQAILAMGPVPTEGQDKTFPGGYTIYAEKCPNRRGVQRAVGLVSDQPMLDFAAFAQQFADKQSAIKTAIITGNFPSKWTTKEIAGGARGKQIVMLDTLPNDLTSKATVLLPTSTWAEKAGTFENAQGFIQAFEQAIAPRELTRPEGQVALDLMAACQLDQPQPFDAEAVRKQMGGAFVNDVRLPGESQKIEPDLTYVRL